MWINHNNGGYVDKSHLLWISDSHVSNTKNSTGLYIVLDVRTDLKDTAGLYTVLDVRIFRGTLPNYTQFWMWGQTGEHCQTVYSARCEDRLRNTAGLDSINNHSTHQQEVRREAMMGRDENNHSTHQQEVGREAMMGRDGNNHSTHQHEVGREAMMGRDGNNHSTHTPTGSGKWSHDRQKWEKE